MKALQWRNFLQLLKETWDKWNADKAPRLGAALAYYTIFSLAPLLLVLIAIVGFVFGPQAAQGQIQKQIDGLVGHVAAAAIQEIVKSAHHPGTGAVATIIGIATIVLGAAGFFGQLQDALNTIWGVAPKPGLGFMVLIRQRLLSFFMVVGTGFLLLASLAVTTWLEALNNYVNSSLPLPPWVLQVLNFTVSFGVITLLFAMIFRGLPDAEIAWRDVWMGSAVTALLFVVGKWGLGLYLSHSTGSAITLVGSLTALLVWIYYAAQILFFGAEFTEVYACKYGSCIKPSAYAVATGQTRNQTPPVTSRPAASAG